MLLVTMTGTSHARSHFQCTLIGNSFFFFFGNSFLNRRKERLREVVQLAKDQTARKYRSRFGASFPLTSLLTFSCF